MNNEIMGRFDNKEKIAVFGAVFNGVRDIIDHAYSGEPKDGVYVRKDSESYPCFDYYDRVNETRSYWNFVFAKSREEAEEKLRVLERQRLSGDNYCKLTEELRPMAYWEGDSHHDVILLL